LLNPIGGFNEVLEHQGDGQENAANGPHALGFGVELLIAQAHCLDSCPKRLSESVLVAVPEHHCHFDDRHGRYNGKEIPTHNMLKENAVFKQAHGNQAAADSGQAGGAAPMLQKTLVDGFAENRDSAENGVTHFSFSN
jgi:hypothetical protein